MGPTHRRMQNVLIGAALAALAGLVCVGVVALIPLALFVLAMVVGENVVSQIASALFVVVASVLLGAVFGASVREKWAGSDSYVFVLFVGAATIGAAAGVFAFVTRGAGLMAVAGLLGVVGAGIAARLGASLGSRLDEPGDSLLDALRRLLP